MNKLTTPHNTKKEKGSKLSDKLITELSPYLCDSYQCWMCENEAVWVCLKCKKYACERHTKVRKTYRTCLTCEGRMYPVAEQKKRFIGSKRAHKRMVGIGKRQRVVKRKGRVIDKGKPLRW